MKRIIEIFRGLGNNEAMAINCRAGIGRTGAALVCIIGCFMNLTGDDAIRYVRQFRTGSVESGPQVKFVRNFLG